MDRSVDGAGDLGRRAAVAVSVGAPLQFERPGYRRVLDQPRAICDVLCDCLAGKCILSGRRVLNVAKRQQRVGVDAGRKDRALKVQCGGEAIPK